MKGRREKIVPLEARRSLQATVTTRVTRQKEPRTKQFRTYRAALYQPVPEAVREIRAEDIDEESEDAHQGPCPKEITGTIADARPHAAAGRRRIPLTIGRTAVGQRENRHSAGHTD